MIADDLRFGVGLLDVSDASRFLGITRGVFSRWVTGYGGSAPLIQILPSANNQARVTFIAMVEAWVLDALLKAGVNRSKIPTALVRLAAEFGREHVLVAPNLATDGIDVLWDFSRTSEGEGLMDARTGQMVMREIVEDYLQYVSWANDNYPNMLRLRSCEPSDVIIDPYRAFGQPLFKASRTRVRDVANMLAAGEDPQVVADEHGVTINDVRTAARVLLGRAA